MTIYRRGNIVLVPFPYSEDREQFKKRPALIVQSDSISRHAGNFIVAQITSSDMKGKSRVRIVKDSPEWEGTNLLGDSTVSTDVLQTIHQDDFIRLLGHLSDMSEVDRQHLPYSEKEKTHSITLENTLNPIFEATCLNFL